MTALLINGTAFGGALLVISLYMQLILGFSPLQAGLGILPFDLTVILASPIGGKLSDRFGYLPFTISGLSVTSIALLWLSTFGRNPPYSEVAVALVLLGVGLGLFNSPSISATMMALPQSARGVGSGMRSTFFNVGLSLSQNLVILILVITLPYAVVSGIISSGAATTSIQIDSFAQGIRNVFFTFGIINSIAIIPSALMGRGRR